MVPTPADPARTQVPLTRRTKTVRETAQIFGVNYETVLDLIKAKELHAIWIGNKYLVPDHAIAAFLGEPGEEASGIRGVVA